MLPRGPGPRVVVVTTSYPRWAGDHAGEFVQGSVRALEAAGASVRIVAPPSDTAQADPRVRRVSLPGPRRSRRLGDSGGIPDRLEREPLAWLGAPGLAASLTAGALWEARRADHIVGHWLLPGALVASLAGRAAGVPSTAILHSGGVALAERMPGGRRAARAVARGARRCVFSNRPLRERFLALLQPHLADRVRRRCAVTAMGVDPSALGPPVSRRAARRRLDVSGRFVVGFLGRCVPVKGLDLLARALEGLPGAVLAVAGEGPDLEGARRIAKRSGVDLRPLGRVEGHHRSAFFAACDVLALPSVVLPSGRTEGTPVVILEALSQGLPVVASDVGGVSEVIHDGRTGYLVPPGDVPALAARLSALDRRPAVRRRMAEAAAVPGRGHHWDRVGPRLAELVLAP